MKISVIGVGAYGLAIAKSLAKQKENNIVMWTEKAQVLEEFKTTKKLESIIKCDIPKNITLTTSLEEAIKDTKIIYMATASRFVDIVCHNMLAFYQKDIPICICSKGIEESTEELLSNVVKKVLKTRNVCVISGPTFAIDIINNEPVGLAIATISHKARAMATKTLANDTLKLRPSADIIGIQLCGAIKNVIAIAAGILKGLGYSDSTQAFLINESMHDIKDIIYYFGGKPKTVLSFAGIGDLMLTCSSVKSRNYSFGYTIGSTNNDPIKVNKYLNSNTVEGYYTLETIYKMLNKKGVEMPLITTIYNIVYNMDDPNKLSTLLIKKK